MTEQFEKQMGPLERGRRRYQKQDFDGAVEAFSEAIKISTDHLLLNALDNRAAAYEKLGQLQFALRDAKEMIDMKPRLSKGYLRCGKVLQLKGEPVIALKIYERGLKKVKVGADNGRVNLQAMYNKLRESLNPGQTRDPLQHLPLELAEMVIEALTMRDRVICLAVSRGWRRILESSHALWTNFDTSNVKRNVSQKALKIHLRRSNWTLERAIISSKSGIDSEKLKLMTKNCKKLKEIQFVGSGYIGESLITQLPHSKSMQTLVVGKGMNITLSTVHDVLRSCHEQLVRATFLTVKGNPMNITPGRWARMDLLKIIHLRADKISSLDVQGLCEATPNATTVILNDWRIRPLFVDLSGWTQLKHLDLSSTQLTRWPLLPLSLTHLLVGDNTQLNIAAEEADPASLPLLETFACHATYITAKYLKLITQTSIKAGHLKRLAIGNRETTFDNTPVEEEFPASPTLEELSLASMIIGDTRMVQIVALYPRLKKLDAFSTKITGVAVREIVNLGVTSLRLSECQDVSTDAVEWARGKGVEVEYLFPSRSQSRVQRYGESSFARGF